MDILKGKTILIGKEPGPGRLLIAIQETGKIGAMGAPGSVPASVSRCKPAEGVAHAKLTVSHNGNLTLTNMKPQNITFVNGSEIVSKRVSLTNTVELGKDHYSISVPAIIEAAKKIAAISEGPKPQPNTPSNPQTPMDISHLKLVYENYETEMDRIVLAQQELGKKRMLPIMVSSASGILSGLGALISLSSLWVTLPVTGVVSFLYFRNYNSKDTSYEDRKNANSEFQHNYVCPSCGHFFGSLGYDLLKNQLRNPKDQKMYCPKCKCELTEKI